MSERNIFTDNTRIWIAAGRPRTALATVGMGTALAAAIRRSSWSVALLTFLTATLLQILSNLANDYGDSVHGADRDSRTGPKRAVQAGYISAKTMRRAIMLVALSAILSGVALLWIAFGGQVVFGFFIFGLLGALALWAAITYTAGRLPYGYARFGDIVVFFLAGSVQ